MAIDFLQLQGRRIVIFGVANRKSVAYHVGQVLADAGAEVIHVVRSHERRKLVSPLLKGIPIHVCDLEHQEEIDRVAEELTSQYEPFHGVVHSVAFADYDGQIRPFHETTRDQGWYETEQVPIPFGQTYLEDTFNLGEEYEKLPRFIPYVMLPIGIALMLFRILQATRRVWRDQDESLIVSHEAEEAVEEAAHLNRDA